MDSRTEVALKVTRRYSFADLLGALWSGGRENALKIREAGKGEEFMRLLSEYAENEEGGVMELTTVNDILWLDFDSVKEMLGMEEHGIAEEE